MNRDVILKTGHLSKKFGLTQALKDVSIEIARGEIVGLIGENGSGKSTFSSVISGLYNASGGTMTLNGKLYKPVNVMDAQRHGIGMAAREMGTLAGIGVADNIFLGKEEQFAKHGIINRKNMYREAKSAMEKIGVAGINPEDPVGKYSFEERKLVEVVRIIYSDPDIFIVDETATALSQKGRDIIYRIMNERREQNKTVLFISHDLEELMTICGKLIILRDGVFIAELVKEEFEEEKIKELMVGRKLTGEYYRSDYDISCSNEIALRAENLHIKGALSGVSLTLHKGEILGVGGLTDCGMHELGRALFGMEKLI